jgi:hypothetical protein
MATPQYTVRAVGSGGQLDINVLSPDDNVGYAFGTDSDAVFYLSSAVIALAAETEGLHAGTSSVKQATAVDSLIISNITTDGDIQMLVSDGNSKEFLFADGSAADLVLGHGMDTATIKTASGVLTLDSGAAINIEPASGSAILLDGTISIDAGVVTGATSVTIGSTVITDGVITDSSGLQLAANLDIDGTADISGDLTLSAGADGALRFSAASSIKILDNSATALVIEEADTAYMTFVTTDSSEAIKFDKNVGIGAAPTDILHATSATASNLLTLENTNTTGSGNRNVVLKVKIAEASGGASAIYFNQGIGNGSADNMGYDVGYSGSQSYFYIRSNDRNGESGDGDVVRIADGTDDVKFLGGISTDDSTPPTSGILVGGGSIDLNNQGGLLNVGASGNDWTQNALSLAGGSAAQTLTMQTTGSSAALDMYFKIPASGTGQAGVTWLQGSGNGDADNMAYQMWYAPPSGQWGMWSADIDGSSTGGNILGILDGTNDWKMYGGLSTDGLTAPTAGISTAAITLTGVAGSVASGIAKAWCVIEDAGTLQGGSFNIASITDNGTGDRTIVFDTDFADTNYSGALAMMQDTNAAININLQKVSIAVGSIVSYCRNTETNSANDQGARYVLFGDQ